MVTDSHREMLDYIHRENVARFQALLASATEDSRRAELRNMIAREAASHALQLQQHQVEKKQE